METNPMQSLENMPKVVKQIIWRDKKRCDVDKHERLHFDTNLK